MKLLLALWLCAGALSAEGAEPVSPTVAVTEAHGFCYGFSLAQWDVFNGAPLAYSPSEVGWAFGNGFRVHTGIDLFYYTGDQASMDTPPVNTNYAYDMMDWRTTMLYRMPLRFRLRPIAGITVEAVRGTRKPTPNFVGGIDVNAKVNPIEAWGFFGLGGMLGMEWLFNRDWSWQLSARSMMTFDLVPSPLVIQTGFNVVL